MKTFLLEHVSKNSDRAPKNPANIFQSLGAEVIPVDESFFAVRVPVKESREGRETPTVVGYVEPYDERFFAYYTVEGSKEARQRVAAWQTDSPDLDATWFSSKLLQKLWDDDVSLRGDHRYVKLVFKHDSLFEMPENAEDESESDEDVEVEGVDSNNEDAPEIERRSTRSELGDRVERIRHSLTALQQSYDPFAALYSLWFHRTQREAAMFCFSKGKSPIERTALKTIEIRHAIFIAHTKMCLRSRKVPRMEIWRSHHSRSLTGWGSRVFL